MEFFTAGTKYTQSVYTLRQTGVWLIHEGKIDEENQILLFVAVLRFPALCCGHHLSWFKERQIDWEPRRKHSRLYVLFFSHNPSSCMSPFLTDHLFRCLPLSTHTCRNSSTHTHWGTYHPHHICLFDISWASGTQSHPCHRLSTVMSQPQPSHISHKSSVIKSGVLSVQWNPTLAVRQRRDAVSDAVRRAQIAIMENLVWGPLQQTACTAVCHLLRPATCWPCLVIVCRGAGSPKTIKDTSVF